MRRIKKSAPVLYQIASFIVNKKNKCDTGTKHQAARVIADTLGVAYSGINTEAFKSAFLSKDLIFGDGKSKIIGTDYNSTLVGAAFYSTLAISSTDYDEGHRRAVGHPASMIVPVAIILGEYLEKSKDEIIRSVIIGYEVATRFSNARFKDKITSYSSGRWGAIGTAATASFLMELSIEQTMHAISNAAILSPVMLGGSTDVSTGSMSKEGAAWAAQSGLQSALFSKNNFIGPYLFVDEHDDYDNKILLDSLGESWLINSNYFKPYSCCRWLHSAIAATIKTLKEKQLNVNSIERIEVDIFERAINLIGNKYPQNPVQAQFHLPYCIALALLYNEVIPGHFTESYLQNSDILRLIDIIVVRKNDDYTDLFPEILPSMVVIHTYSGKQFAKEILSAPWDADNPPLDESLKRKFISQVGDNNNQLWNEIIDY